MELHYSSFYSVPSRISRVMAIALVEEVTAGRGLSNGPQALLERQEPEKAHKQQKSRRPIIDLAHLGV